MSIAIRSHRFLILFALTAFVPGLTAQVEDEPSAQDAAAQEDEGSRRERVLAKTRELLEQRPTHPQLFDRYFKQLVESNVVDQEIESLQARLKDDPEQSGVSVVLGRLLLRAGKEEQALEVLEGAGTDDPSIQGVLGDIYFKLARFDRSRRAFQAALPGARTPEDKRILFEKLGKAELALGNKEAALSTWGQIAELDGGSFLRRLYVAELCVEAGLLDEAEKAYQPLLEETKNDPEDHCRVLRDVGRLAERRGNLDEALSTYERILELTARGHWLRKEVEGRIVQVYQRTGRLEELVARLEKDMAEAPDDLATAEMCAAVLTGMRELDRAVAVLQKLTPRFPKDVNLARRVAELHVEREDIDAAIREYQRILEEKPDELEMYLELGGLFARSDRFAEAKLQWEQALAKRMTDATLCARLASTYALFDQTEDAARLYRRAIELEPESMPRYVDLAQFLIAHGRGEEGIAVLDEALVAADGAPRRLEILVPALRENELTDKAQQALEGILAAEPDNHEVRYALADLLLDRGEIDRARTLLWEVVDRSPPSAGNRTLAANTLAGLARSEEQRAALVAEAGSRDTAGAAFVIGRAKTRARDFEGAIEAYRTAVERDPLDVESRRLLARLYAEEGRYDEALEAYSQIAMVAPGEQRHHFREVARLHLERYDLDAAIETWQRAMRDHPDNAAVFVQVGKEFLDVNRVQEALDAFRQASRLKSDDPEILMQLADALKRTGRVDEAEEHLLSVATGAVDPRDRELARVRLFQLYAEQGRIEQRMAELRSQTAENPYDQHAPQLLADLYIRTGDFVLGLDMVDQAVRFQPRNEELLTRRAEILEALEDWQLSHDQHAELLKFPGADRDAHLAGMGRALFELGRADEAKALFRDIQDRGRVRDLYERYRLHDEAVEYYRRVIARDPSDVRAHYRLAVELEKLRRPAEAAEALEQALNLRPYFKEALELVGKLYVQSGRRDDGVRVGLRLFGMRGEEVEKSRDEEREEEMEQERRSRSSRYSYGGFNPRRMAFTQQRLQAAQSYFQELGLDDEWARALLAEARRRPTDLALYEGIKSHFQWRDRSPQKLLAFLDELLDNDFSRVRVPPGYTARSYHEMLERDRLALFGQDAAIAEARVQELGDETEPKALLERAFAQRALGRLDAAIADLRAAIDADGENVLARALLAELLVEQKDYAGAIPHVEAIVTFWEAPRDELHAEIERRHAESFSRGYRAMLDALPRHVRRRVDDGDLRAVVDRTRSSGFSVPTNLSHPESAPDAFACAVKLVRLHRASGDEGGLAAAVERARPLAHNLAQRASLGQVLYQERCIEAASEVLLGLRDELLALRTDPLQVYFWDRYVSSVRSVATELGDVLAQSGDLLGACRTMRELGAGQKAELLIQQSGRVEELIGELESRVAEQRAALEAARGKTGGDLRSAELDYRDAVIELADVHVGAKTYDRAEKVYRDSLDLLPDDIDVREVVAKLAERRGDAEAAIAMHKEIVDVKRRRRRASGGDDPVPPTRLRPSMPGETVNERNVFGSGPYLSGGVIYSGPYYGGSPFYGGYYSRDPNEVSSSYSEILRVQGARDDSDGILETLRWIVAEDPATFRRMSWDILNTLRNQNLGKRKLPILRILRGVIPDDEWLTLEYARACRDEDELDEARQVLEKGLARAAATGSGYVDQFQQELDRVLQRLGEAAPGVDDLRARVEAEPDNVRHRVQLAHALKDDHRYTEAFEEVKIIVDKAPYLDEAKTMYVGLAAAAGHDDLAIEMQRRVYEEETDHERKLWRGVELAQWLWAADRHDEARALIDEIEEQAGGSDEFSAGNWYLDHGDVEEAIVRLRRQLERMQGEPYYRDQLRTRTARLELASDQEVAGMSRLLDALEEAGSLAEREERFKALLLRAKEHPDPSGLLAKLEPEFGDRSSVRDLLVMAAVEFAVGDRDAALGDIEKALEQSSKEVYLFPLLLGMERLHDDFEGAIAVLDRMERVYGGSETMRWSDGVTLSERDGLKIVRAELFDALERTEQVHSLIESIADETEPQTFQRVSSIYSQRGDKQRAYDWLRRYHEKLGTRDRQHLVAEANMLLELDRVEEALPLVEEAYVMARGGDGTRDLLVRIHRDRGTLPEVVTRLEEELERDFRDSGVRSELLGLYKELERDDARRAIYERMLEHEDLIESGLTGLATFHRERGELREQLAILERRLERVAGRVEERLQSEIAELLMELDEVEPAIEHFSESVDVDTADGKKQLGEWLVRHQEHRRALPILEEARRLDPDLDGVLVPLLSANWHERQWERTIEVALEKFEEERGQYEPLYRTTEHAALLDALSGLPEERVAELLEGQAGDAPSLVRAALLRIARNDAEGALVKAEAAMEAGATSLLPLEIRRMALMRLERFDDLPAAIEELREAIEFDCIVEGSWRHRNRALSLQDEIGRIEARRGDVAAAEAAWRAPPLRRESETSASGVWRGDWATRFVAQKWLDVREPERALAALQDEFLLYESAPWALWTSAMERLGRVEEVEGFAWQRHLDPLELYGVRSDSYSWIWIDGEYRRSNGMQEFLVDSYRRRGRLEALRTRAAELQQRPETRRQAEQILEALARLTDDHRWLAERAERQAEEEGEELFGADAYRLAEQWLRAGEAQRALGWLERVLDFDRPALDRPVRADQRNRYYSYRSDDAGGDNPFAFGFDGGSSSWWSSYRSEDLDDWRRAAVAALRSSGDAARADTVEADLLDQPTRDRRLSAARALASAYSRWTLPAEAARVLRGLLADEALELDETERDSLQSALVSALDDGDDEAAYAAAVEARIESLRGRVAAEPGPSALNLRGTLAHTLVHQAGRPDEGLAEIESLLAVRPEDEGWLALRARALLDLGRADEAIAQLAELSESHRWQGEQDPVTETAILGLALAKLGRHAEAVATLEQAVDRLSRDSDIREEVVEVLGQLR